MGFHPAWKYRRVHELQFIDGQVAATEDLSEQMEDVRRRIKTRDLQPDHDAPDAEVQKWIEDCFSLDYT